MSLFIKFFIINFRYFLIAQRWNHSVYFIFHGKLNYTFIVIFLVCYRIFRGITRASTTTCTFLFTALLRPPCLDLRLLHHLRAYDTLYTFTVCNILFQISSLISRLNNIVIFHFKYFQGYSFTFWHLWRQRLDDVGFYQRRYIYNTPEQEWKDIKRRIRKIVNQFNTKRRDGRRDIGKIRDFRKAYENYVKELLR